MSVAMATSQVKVMWGQWRLALFINGITETRPISGVFLKFHIIVFGKCISLYFLMQHLLHTTPTVWLLW